MFLDVTLYGTGIVGAAREILESWREEHEGYYALPHGQTPLSRQYGGFGFDTLPPSGGLWLTSGLNYHALQIVRDEDGVECVRLTYSGRRHGMRGEFARFLRTYWDTSVEVSPGVRRERNLHAYVTQEPDWLPWETRDDRPAEEVDAVSLDEYYTTYASGYGRHEAIQLPWDVVEAILGHPHEGSAEDDTRLIEALVRSGAPGWVRTAEGWVDEHGWGLIGPRIEEVDADA